MSRYTYDAWGAVSYSVSSMQNMQLAASLYNVNPFTYRGYCYDDDIGMYYLQSRYYDPQICRFINADSTDYLGATGTVLSYNLFAYCENDAVNCVDATGTASTNGITLEQYIRQEYKSYLSIKNKNSKNGLYWGSGKLSLQIKKNSIVISANFRIQGNLANKKVDKYAYASWFICGIQQYWSGTYSLKFKKYSINATLKTYATQFNSSAITVKMNNAMGVSKTDRIIWSYSSCGSITMYKGDSRNKKIYSGNNFAWVSAHEFGHILGTSDLGNDTKYTIMGAFNNKLYEKDIRRVLEAFIKNTWISWR